jgi:hypothetical protein
MKVLGLLQNAWSPYYAGREWPRAGWLEALHDCRSGRRLKILQQACPQADIWYDNTTPIVGARPDSVVPPDMLHVASLVAYRDYFIAFGRQAQRVLIELEKARPLLIVPHPAHRLLTDALYRKAGHILREGFTGTVELRPRNGSIEVNHFAPLAL